MLKLFVAARSRHKAVCGPQGFMRSQENGWSCFSGDVGRRMGPESWVYVDPVAEIVPSRYTSLISLRFIVQWIHASLVAHLYLLYEDTRIRYPLLSFSCTLLVTEEPGSAIAAHSLVLLDPRRLVGQCKYLPF